MKFSIRFLGVLAIASSSITLPGCTKPAPAGTELVEEALIGTWRSVLESPGGELPFALEISQTDGQLTAAALNGSESAPFSSVKIDGNQVTLAFDFYDSAIEAALDQTGHRMSGSWSKVVPAGLSTLAFRASKDDVTRFEPEEEVSAAAAGRATISGSWVAEFTDDSGTEPARAEFEQDGKQVLGTFLTPTGDYRFLEGSFESDRLRLSTFDGAHAFLFDATLDEGEVLRGDFWSRDTYHATWTAERIAPDASVLPDAWSLAGLTNDEGRFRFRFPDLDGNPVALTDRRFEGKVVVVNIFGSWCPNCNDKAPLLAKWDRMYREQGLEIVGLAYEFTGDVDRDRRMVRRFAERHRISFPLLLAGLSDKAKAAETLPDLDKVVAFPTSVFVGRDGKVRKIHTGFAGPGTGAHHEQLVVELEDLLEDLLGETAS